MRFVGWLIVLGSAATACAGVWLITQPGQWFVGVCVAVSAVLTAAVLMSELADM